MQILDVEYRRASVVVPIISAQDVLLRVPSGFMLDDVTSV